MSVVTSRPHDRGTALPDKPDPARLLAENAELRCRLEAAEAVIARSQGAAPLRDLERRVKPEQRLAVEHEVSRILARAANMEEAVPSVLLAIRCGLSMDFCALWLPAERGQTLRCHQFVTAEGAQGLNPFLQATQKLEFLPGQSLPGRVWKSDRAIWIESLANDTSFERSSAATAAGLHTGGAAPLSSDAGCHGVLEWYYRHPMPFDPSLVATMEALGAEVGQFLLRKRAEAMVEVRARQQQELANLGMAAIYQRDLQALFDEAVTTVCRVLGVELCKLLELLPDGKEALLRAGIGWREGLVGRATVGMGRDSQTGYTLLTDEPVIVEDIGTETRFTPSPLLLDHKVISGLSCIILDSEKRAWGVLAAHTTSPRVFTRDDVAFLQGVANVLAASIQRRQGEDKLRASEASLREERQRLSAVLDALPIGVAIADADGKIVRNNVANRELWGIPPTPASWKCYADWIGYWPETGERIKADEWALARALLKKEIVRSELVQNERFSTGERRFFLNNAAPILDAEGNVVGGVVAEMDVTEMRHAEEQLRRNAETFYNLIQNNPFGIYLVDADFRLVQVSAGSRKVFENVRPLLGRDFNEVIRTIWPEPFASEVLDHFRHTLETGETYGNQRTVEQREDIPDVEAWDWRIERIILPDGRYGVVCYAYDLSERLEYEDALRKSEERYRLVNRATNDVIWDWDIMTNELLWNEALEATFGYRLADVPRTLEFWYDRLHPEDRDRVIASVHAAIDGNDEAWHEEYRFRRSDGTYAHVLDRGHVHREGGRPVRMIGSMLDITERLAAEQALRESESFYRQTLESIPGMTFTNKPDGSCDYVSEQWVEFTGIPATELLGDLWLGFVHPNDRDRVHTTWIAAVEGRCEYDLEFRVRRRDGEYEWFKVRGRAIRDQSGKVARWFGAALNINTLKQAEEALREADRRKDEFLAMLAHELRNPLAPIRNAVQILGMIGPKERRLDNARAMIERQVSHLVRLVDDLLDVSRVSRGKITLQKETLELAAVIRQAVETSRPLLDARHHELKVTLCQEPVRIEGDFTRLAQVVSNLLNNAAKYTDNGGRVEVIAERAWDGDRPEAVIRVRDNGRGIDPKALDSLFDLFYQVDRNLDRSEGGLGIGLSLVKSLVEMHGGRVEAHSEGRGKGSEFVVRLPAVPEEPTKKPVDGPGMLETKGRGLRILVVDDNQDSVETMAMLLEIEGHEVLTAYDGEQAVEVALAERPRVIFLDIGLPHLDGYQACRAIREGGLRDAVLVAMTGYGQEEDRRLSQEAGFDVHLVKPVELPTIRELLKRAAGG